MGGIGSGRHWPNKKVLTTDCRKLDVLELYRAGALKSGAIGRLNWADDKDGHVSFSCEADSFHLSYQGHFFTNEISQDRHSIPLVWSDCRYSSQRPYFHCTGHNCNNIVEHLYSHGEAFLCRFCLNLAYPCQNESIGDRAARRAGKVRVNLGGSDGILTAFPDKPKGMHWRTYSKLYVRAMADGDQAFKYVYTRLGGAVDDLPTSGSWFASKL
jgi:hypothetical protein